jgi:hypothetical protein
MRVSEEFPSKYLSASDLNGESMTLTIDHVETTELEGKRKMVLFFRRAKKGMVLNKTNAGNIAAAYGDETDDWQGKELVLFPAWVDYQGKSVEAVRVRAPTAKDRKPAERADPISSGPQPTRQKPARDLPDDEIPF